MRWRECHICDAKQDCYRDETHTKQVVIYECHCCWEDYCDICGEEETRICDRCLDEAYIANYGYPYPVSNNDPMGIESAPEWIKEQAEIVKNMNWIDYEYE